MNAIKQVFVIGAVIAICMVFIVEFRPGTDIQITGTPQCAAEIQGNCLAYTDFMAAYRLVAPPNADDEMLKRYRLRELALNGLIERWLLVEDAKRLGITASDDDVRRQLFRGLARVSFPVAREQDARRLSYQGGYLLGIDAGGPARRLFVKNRKTGKFDFKSYKSQATRLSNMTLAGFLAFQKSEAIAARVRDLVRSRVQVSEGEAFSEYAQQKEQAVVDYVKLERPYYANYVVDVSKKAVDKWAKEHQAELDEAWKSAKDNYLPECRQASHILVRVDNTAEDKEAAKASARAKIEAARKRIKAGAPFSTVARELSQDSLTASRGGRLGCFAAGKLSKPNTGKAIDDAVYAMKVGSLSDIIETNYGFHLIKLVRSAKDKAAEKIGQKEQLGKLYREKEAERLTVEGAKQILAAVKAGKSLSEALDTHLDAVLPKEAKKLFVEGRKNAEEAESGGPSNAWTDDERPQLLTSDPFSKTQPPFYAARNGAKATQKVFALAKAGEVVGDPVQLYQGFAVLTLKEKKSISKEDWKNERRDFVAGMRQAKQADALIAYMQRLRSKYGKEIIIKIRLNEDAKAADNKG